MWACECVWVCGLVFCHWWSCSARAIALPCCEPSSTHHVTLTEVWGSSHICGECLCVSVCLPTEKATALYRDVLGATVSKPLVSLCVCMHVSLCVCVLLLLGAFPDVHILIPRSHIIPHSISHSHCQSMASLQCL